MTKTNNAKVASFIERAIENDRKKVIIIKDEATQIFEEAIANDNPAASLAKSAIEEADYALEHYEIDAERTELKDIAESLHRAHLHIVKAETLLERARAFFFDPIFPKAGDPA